MVFIIKPNIKKPKKRAPNIKNMSYAQIAERLREDMLYNTGFTEALDEYDKRQEAKKEKELQLFEEIEERHQQAYACEKSGDYEKALTLYTENLKLNPTGTVYYDRPCIMLEKIGRYDEAVEICLQALKNVKKMNADPNQYYKRIDRLKRKNSQEKK